MNSRLIFALLWLTPFLCQGASSISYFLNVEALTNVTARSAVRGLTGTFTNSLSAAGFNTIGTTNATLTGNLMANGGFLTNGLTLGAHTVSIWGSDASSGLSILNVSDVDAGDLNAGGVDIYVLQDSTFNVYGLFQAELTTNSTSFATGYSNSGVDTLFHFAANESTDSYLFEAEYKNVPLLRVVKDGTIIGTTNAITILTLQNNGADKALFQNDGTGLFSGAVKAGSGVFTNGITSGASTFNGPGNVVTITNTATTDVGLTINGFSGQTNSLMEIGSGGTNFIRIQKEGSIQASDGVSTNSPYGFKSRAGTGLFYRNGGVVGNYNSSEAIAWASGTVTMASGILFGWSLSSTLATGAQDLILLRDAAASLQMGADSATPISQTFKGPDGSGSNIAGGAIRHDGGYSTGTAAGGPVVIRTANSAGATSSSLNTASERFHAIAKWVTLTSATATTIFTVPVPLTNYVGLTATVTVYATDGTDHQSKTSVITCDAINKAGTITETLTQVDNTTATSSGTLTATYDSVDAGSNVLGIRVAADSSLSETVLRAKIVITAINSNGSAAVTEQ